MKPLDNIVVIDLSRILAGPFCSMQLADMGASVIKIEIPGRGDDTRYFGPPFIEGESAYFMSINRNKKSMTLNLKNPKALKILHSLLEEADVLLENFRPGTMAKLGLDPLVLREQYPKLIICSISGFGQTGPDRLLPGYDVIVQGEAGISGLTGEPDGPPVKVGTSIADLTTGLVAVQGILTALYSRTRTGEGQLVDVSLMDSMASMLTYQAGNYFATGEDPKRMGNAHLSIVPYSTYACQDGSIILGVANERLFIKFCSLFDRSELVEDKRFRTASARVENREILDKIVNDIFAGYTRKTLIELLRTGGIPCGSVAKVSEVFENRQLLARDMVVEVKHSKAGTIKVLGIPVKLSETPGSVVLPPPVLGEHTEEILTNMLGISSEEIRQLEQDGVI